MTPLWLHSFCRNSGGMLAIVISMHVIAFHSMSTSELSACAERSPGLVVVGSKGASTFLSSIDQSVT